jgi:hypothetical protein
MNKITNTFMIRLMLIWFAFLSTALLSQSSGHAASWKNVEGKLVAVTETKTEEGPDGRSLTVTVNLKTGAVVSRMDIYAQNWGMVGGKLVAATVSKTMELEGNTMTVTTCVKTGAVISRMDAVGRNWGMVGGKLVAATVSKQIDVGGTEQEQTHNLKTNAMVSSVDPYGNQWGIDEKGKLGPRGEFRMLFQAMGSEVISGTEVTKMKDLLTGEIKGTDILGNQYGLDKAGQLGAKGAFVITGENLGTEIIEGTEVTKMKDLLTGKISGTDILENHYKF